MTAVYSLLKTHSFIFHLSYTRLQFKSIFEQVHSAFSVYNPLPVSFPAQFKMISPQVRKFSDVLKNISKQILCCRPLFVDSESIGHRPLFLHNILTLRHVLIVSVHIIGSQAENIPSRLSKFLAMRMHAKVSARMVY